MQRQEEASIAAGMREPAVCFPTAVAQDRRVCMLFRWFRSMIARPLRPVRAGRRSAVRPGLEALEDRTLLTAGALDPNFGSFGKTVVAFDKGGSLNDQARAVAVDAQGRTI